SVTGLFRWDSSGVLTGVGGHGSLTAAGGTDLISATNGAHQVLSGFHFVNPAGQMVTWENTEGYLFGTGGEYFDNYVTVNLQGRTIFVKGDATGGTFNNYGSLVKSGSARDSSFEGVGVTNSGSIDVQAGTLYLGDYYVASLTTNTG